MLRKRRNTSSPESDDSASPKRHRSSPASGDCYGRPSRLEQERAKVDAVYGMTGAFPDLDGNDEPFYGPANDGIEYLRMVRSEAKSVPLLLHAPREEPQQELDEEGQGDWEEDGGYYEDGAFVAHPVQDTSEKSGPTEVQKLYYVSLLRRYRQLQGTLKITPPLSAIELLTSSRPISFPPNSKNARTRWREVLRTKQPHPTQVACMDAESVLTMIGLLADCMSEILRGGTSETVNLFGAWAWALLGKSRDVSELGSEEVSELRRLGRKAADLVEMSRSVLGSDDEDQDGQSRVDGVTPDMGILWLEPPQVEAAEEVVDLTLEEMKSQLRDRVDNEVENTSSLETHNVNDKEAAKTRLTVVILDMIITVVGEVYGQRDLLRFRHLWSPSARVILAE